MNKYQKAFDSIYRKLDDLDPYKTWFGESLDEDKDLSLIEELVEKETPKETIWGEEIDKEWGLHHLGPKCPTCGKFVTRRETFFYGEEYSYCGFCGQRLKWGDENEE